MKSIIDALIMAIVCTVLTLVWSFIFAESLISLIIQHQLKR